MEHFRGQIFAYGDDRSLIPISVTSIGGAGAASMWQRPATPPPAGFDEKELADKLPSTMVVSTSDTPCCICIDELEPKQVQTQTIFSCHPLSTLLTCACLVNSQIN
jgi:hypothetical protein